jgi:hypothetical protein
LLVVAGLLHEVEEALGEGLIGDGPGWGVVSRSASHWAWAWAWVQSYQRWSLQPLLRLGNSEHQILKRNGSLKGSRPCCTAEVVRFAVEVELLQMGNFLA